MVDWTSGLDWWTGLMDWASGLTLNFKMILRFCNETHLSVGLHDASY